MGMIGIIIAVIIGIILLGVVFKLLKFALILAIVVGVAMLAQDKFGTKRIK
jgi:multidrug transporter EmrE-like cation transporter